MALKVGDLYATIRLQDSEFNAGIDRAGSKFQGLKSAVATGTKVLATGFAAGTTALVGLGAAAMQVGLDYNRLQQTSRAALTAILGSAEAAADQMDRLDEFARTSPFAKQTFITAQQQMLAFGIETEKVIPYLDAMQQAVAATGGSNAQLGEMALIMGKISSTSKITAEDLNQFGERGVNAAQLIGDQMGFTAAEIREKISAGTLDAGEALDALAAGMQATFGGATALVKQQMDGAVDRVKGAFRDIGSILAAPFIDPNGGGRAVEWTNQVADAMRSLEAKIRPTVAILETRFAPQLGIVNTALDLVNDSINRIDVSKLNRQLDELGKYAPIIAGVGTAMFSLGTQSVPLLGVVNPLVAGFVAMAAVSPELRGAFTDAAVAAAPLLPLLGNLAVVAADVASQVLVQMSPALRDLMVSGAEVAVLLGGALLPALGDLLVAGLPLVEMLAGLISWIAQLPTPVLAAVAAFALLHSPIGSATTAIAGFVTTAARIVQERVAVQAALGGVGTASATMGAAMVGAQGAARGLGAALTTAFVGNPVGLAITGITVALSLLVTRQAEANQAARQLTDAMIQQGGVAGELSDKWAINALSTSGALEAAEKLGINLQDLTAAATGNVEAYERVTAAMADYRKVATDMHGGTPLDKELNLVERELDKLQDTYGKSAEAARRHADASGGVGDASRSNADALRDENAELQRQQDLQRTAADASLSLAEAKLRAAEQADRTNESIAEYNRLVESGVATEQELVDARRDMEQQLLSTVRGYNSITDAMRRNNADAAALNEVIAAQREQFVLTATQMGYTAEEASRMADELGLIPNRVDIEIDADASEAMLALEEARQRVRDAEENIRINGDSASARAELESARQAVRDAEDRIRIDAENAAALQRLEEARAEVRAAEDDIRINGDNGPAHQRLQDALAAVRAAEAAITVNANTGGAEAALANLTRTRYMDLIVQIHQQGQIPTAGFGQVPVADGGWITPGRAPGGWVPAPYPGPGIDNILWPLNSGGRTLAQPLAGGEFVVNGADASRNAQLLEWINAGNQPRFALPTPDLGVGLRGAVITVQLTPEQFEALNRPTIGQVTVEQSTSPEVSAARQVDRLVAELADRMGAAL